MKRTTLALFAFLTAFPVIAQSTTPILIPIFYRGAGQFGSQWSTSVHIVNGSAAPLEGRGITFLITCPIPEGCSSPIIPARDWGRVEGPLSDRGLVLHAAPDVGEALEFQALFGDGERRFYELPIVREDDLRDEPFSLPSVPFLGQFRTTLRIYSPDPLTGQQARVTIRGASDPFGEPIDSRIVTLAYDEPHGLPMRPAFAELVLQRDFTNTQHGSVRITIEPAFRLDGRVPRVWAFATVTFNDRNDVIVLTPQ